MPVDESTLPDDHFIEVDNTPSYQTTSAKLNFANSSKNDPLQGKIMFKYFSACLNQIVYYLTIV